MKYYKIVDPEGHWGLVYKEGYNEDPIPFDPSGDCLPGGIYFSREDILDFIHFGTELYEVEPVGEVYENPGYPKKWKAHAVNLKHVGPVSTETLQMLIAEGAVPSGSAFRGLTRNAHLSYLKALSGHITDTFGRMILREAVLWGHPEIATWILTQDIALNDNDFLHALNTVPLTSIPDLVKAVRRGSPDMDILSPVIRAWSLDIIKAICEAEFPAPKILDKALKIARGFYNSSRASTFHYWPEVALQAPPADKAPAEKMAAIVAYLKSLKQQ